MSNSDRRYSIVDLTDDDADDEKPTNYPPPANGTPEASSMRSANVLVPPPSSTPLPPVSDPRPNANPHTYPPLPGGRSGHIGFPYAITAPQQQTPDVNTMGRGHNGAAWNGYVPVPGYNHDAPEVDRAAKRVKVHHRRPFPSPGHGGVPTPIPTVQQASMHKFRPQHNPRPTPPSSSFSLIVPDPVAPPRATATSKNPSVHKINQALKINGGDSTPGLDGFGASSPPRTLHIGRGPPGSSSPPATTWQRPSMTPQGCTRVQKTQAAGEQLGPAQQIVAEDGRRRSVTGKPASTQQNHLSAAGDVARPKYFAGPAKEPREEDKDSIISDTSTSEEPVSQRVPDRPGTSSYSTPVRPATTTPTAIPNAQPLAIPPKRRKTTNNPFDIAQDHFLIFLKEVKQYKWTEITREYNKDMARREYHTLQSRYSTVLNKRNRALDPPTLVLPSRFAAEATIDWSEIHQTNASSRGPRGRSPLDSLHHPTTQRHREHSLPKPLFSQQTNEHDYSSGCDSAPVRGRSRRAQRVNYTWPKQRGGFANVLTEDYVDGGFGDADDDDVPMRSDTTEEDFPLPGQAIAVENDPVEVDFDDEDARLGLKLLQKNRDNSTKMVPYLSASQRSSMRSPPDSEWDQPSSREWQGLLLHVDFSPSEIKTVIKAITSVNGSARSRHSTRRRQLRELTRGLTDAKTVQLIEWLRQHLPCRERSSIRAFVEDAREGKVAEAPQIQRLAAARPDVSLNTTQKRSTTSILRQRELGLQSRRGWQAASKPLTYQMKNKFMDTIGPSACWTGASSDIHTVAWAPDGERFAAGAVAVDDPDSMQYNRSNNLLFGDTMNGSIHELAEHYRIREKTESGVNSSHAMFASQDRKLYTTVSSVAFSPSGRFMYSAGYDRHIGIWHTDTESVQPTMGAKLHVRDPIDILSVNHAQDGILATAARVDRKAIRVLRIDEEDLSQFTKSNYQSQKAVSRTNLKILPSALQFEPLYGGLLLAGFGANMKETGFDTTGDLCLWDIQAESPLTIHGANKNVFDVTFNPNRSRMPAFAIGCVAGANVNRGTRSEIRLYDINDLGKYTCPLGFECKALDINDVVWCPHDEHLIAAGCTDGRTYVWDARWPDFPLRTLSHGQSLMPLQEDVKHEITDTGVRFLSWGENATRLYSGSSDGVVKVWDVTRAEENTFIKDLVTTDSGIMSGAFSADYSKLIIGEVNGSINVLEVGRDDTSLKEADKLRYVPYQEDDQEETQDLETGEMSRSTPESGIYEAQHLLQTNQMQLTSMGSLPIRQALQGPSYAGPYDQSIDAPFLRQQALDFQLSLTTAPSPQCSIPGCRDNLNKTTAEDVGDSGRSSDRLPDELRRQWKTAPTSRIIPGKAQCSNKSCGRPARPSTESAAAIKCERCAFACFRCGAVTSVAPATTTLECVACAGRWEIGVLGYECVTQPGDKDAGLDVPGLKVWGRETYTERLEDVDTGFGDEVNALTEYYLGLGI